MQCDNRKISIIGLGNVGVTAAYALLLTRHIDELVLVSRSLEKAKGEKLDLEHSIPFLHPVTIKATDSYAEVKGSDIIIITAGTAQKPGQTRLDLVKANHDIFAELLPQLAPYVENSIVVVVSNPVDVLTFVTASYLQNSSCKVIGTGTMLDTARFRYHLGEELAVSPSSIHAYILGEHGDSSVLALDAAHVGGVPLTAYPSYSPELITRCLTKTREAAYNIIKAKGATFYAIGVVISHLAAVILGDQKKVLPVSTVLQDYQGQSKVAASVPCVISRSGIDQVLPIHLTEEEKTAFITSCQSIQETIAQVM